MKIKTCRFLAATAVMLAAAFPAHAQYPNRTVRLIVPFPAGSTNDILARAIQAQFASELGQQVVIDNRAGAGGNLGAEVAAKSPPDGYTVVLGSVSQAISMSLYSRLGYDFVKDFEPVSLVAAGSFMLASHPSLPPKTVKALIAFARQRPGDVNVATSGASIRLSAKLLESMAKIRMTEVNYKGTPQLITAVVSGEAPVGFPSTSAAVPHVRSKRLHAMAVTSSRRSSMVPEVPTIAEAGVPGYEVASWYGFMVPAGTPADIVARLNAATVKAIAHPDVKSRFARTDLALVGGAPGPFGDYIRREVAKWTKVVRESGMRVE